MESDQRPEGADSGAAATRKPARQVPTPLLLYMLAQHVENAGGGSLAVGCKEDGSWIVSAEFGREAEDSPMAGGAAYGLHARLRRALEVACHDCGLIEKMAEDELDGAPEGYPPEVLEMYATGADDAARSYRSATGVRGTQSDNLITALAVALASNAIVMASAQIRRDMIFGGGALAAFLSGFSDPATVPPEVEEAIATVASLPRAMTEEEREKAERFVETGETEGDGPDEVEVRHSPGEPPAPRQRGEHS